MTKLETREIQDPSIEREKGNAAILKRITRLLDPLSDHPFLQTIGFSNDAITPKIFQLAQEHPEQLAKDIKPGRLSLETGILDTFAAYHAEQEQPGRSKEQAKQKAVEGYKLFKLLYQARDNTDNLPSDKSKKPDTPHPITKIRALEKASSLQASIYLMTDIAYTIANDKPDGTVYTDEQRLLIFAASIGFTQTLFQRHIETALNPKTLENLSQAEKEKVIKQYNVKLNEQGTLKRQSRYQIRDYVLNEAMYIFSNEEKLTGIVEYLIGQKETHNYLPTQLI